MDLSCWQVAFNGAEPVRPATVERFGERFAPFGLRPENVIGCYGLAEGTLIVSGCTNTDPKSVAVDRDGIEHDQVREPVPGEPVTRLATCGRVPPGVRLEIVDPADRVALPPDTVGEVWVAGPSVVRGYWGGAADPSLGARLGDDPTPFLRTGDLGFVHNGLLYLSGRIKDLLIVRGRNVQPHEVEDAAQAAHRLIRPGGCAAFHLDDVRIALVAETSAGDDFAEVAAVVRQAVLADQQVALAAVFFGAGAGSPEDDQWQGAAAGLSAAADQRPTRRALRRPRSEPVRGGQLRERCHERHRGSGAVADKPRRRVDRRGGLRGAGRPTVQRARAGLGAADRIGR
ncbi:AMP-binding protein [Fodinicola feengrottensis]|uniref:AMP-binding protein n=1 Tax=Fodinicola feengrottensis TaxID=435914 RepID=UPI0013D0F5EB|nr:AMP-binding protein [Fodinicola feengrottensis]